MLRARSGIAAADAGLKGNHSNLRPPGGRKMRTNFFRARGRRLLNYRLPRGAAISACFAAISRAMPKTMNSSGPLPVVEMICFRSAGLGSRLRCGFERSPKRRSQCRPRQEYSRPRSSLVSYRDHSNYLAGEVDDRHTTKLCKRHWARAHDDIARPVAAVHMIYRLEQRTVKMHGDECRNRVQWNTYPRIIEIEGIINPLEQTDIDIHPLYWPVARVVDGMRMA